MYKGNHSHVNADVNETVTKNNSTDLQKKE